MKLNWDRYRDFGLLLLRVGVGIMMIAHGWPKIAAGPAMWGKIGQAMGALGINFAPTFWGFMAAFAESVGGLLLVLGLFFRPTLVFLMVPTMLVAMLMHKMVRHDPFNIWSHAATLGLVFIAMIFIGPGRYSLDAKMRRRWWLLS